MVRITKPVVVAAVVAFLIYSVVLRNLPWPPFDWFYVPDLSR